MSRIIWKNISWFVLGTLMIAGLVASLYFSIQPRPVPKIRYSLFVSPKDLGTALTQRLRLEIKQAPVVFFGIDSSNLDHYQIVMGALEALRAEGDAFDVLVVDPHLTHKTQIPHEEEIELKLEQERFSEGIRTAKELKKRVAVVLPAIYASTLLETSHVSKFLGNEKGSGLVFTLSNFPTNPSEERDLRYPCVPHQEDRMGTRNLGCMIISKAKTLYRKKNPGPKRAGLVDQVGLSEYLVLLN